jgi:adenosylhomocysteine nucleosidase
MNALLAFSAILTLLTPATPSGVNPAANAPVVVLISANTEWKVLRALLAEPPASQSPFGEWFAREVGPPGQRRSVVFVHGGWGKIAAAGSTQYAIDRWKPRLLVNLGTCGGFGGVVEKGDVLLVDKTVVYDIVEMMGDPAEAIADYSTTIDLAWVGADLPAGVRRGSLVSADRDLQPSDIPHLQAAYGALAADWESGSIAWVAAHSKVPLIILRGVSDVVGKEGSETYGNMAAFEAGTRLVMKGLLDALPGWVDRFDEAARRRREPARAAAEKAHARP